MTISSITERIEATAEELFGWTRLRPGLGDAIAQVVDGHDVLAIMPTGYGKSAIYKVAGALLPGMTVVVSPLIALQDDQVAGIQDRPEAPRAVAVNSARSERENEEAWDEVAAGEVEYLFLSPEQLARDDVTDRLAAASVSLFVVDEAHCVSSWGHDFRPDYLRLSDAADAIGRPVILAMTATGAGPVRQEIIQRLELRDPVLLSRGYDRPNIRLEVVRHSDPDSKRAAVVDDVLDLPHPGLLYVGTRGDTELYAEALADRGIRAAAYHGGLRSSERRRLHEGFRDDEYDVVVATSAFGMGIDKSGIRFVMHAAVPESVDEYYQELGRAGRDGEPALARLHYRAEDLGLRSFFAGRTPDKKRLERVMTALTMAGRAVHAGELGTETGLSSRQLGPSLSLLIDAGAVRDHDDGIEAVAGVGIRDAVAAAVEQAENRQHIDESRIAMMRSYAETLACRRIFLLGYFGEELDEPCGNCDTCTSGTAYEQHDQPDADSEPYPVDAAVRHREWGDGTVMKVEDDRITVFFESEGYRVLSLAVVAENDLLELVG